MVATAETLLKMKAATLVSRASEKDLYDLAWFFEQDEQLDVARLDRTRTRKSMAA